MECKFMTNDKFKPGDVVYCEFKNTDENTVLLKKKRPFVIISNIDATRVSPILQVVPLTTKNKKLLPTHVKIKRSNGYYDIAICEQIMTVETKDIEETSEWINLHNMNKIKDGIRKVFDL